MLCGSTLTPRSVCGPVALQIIDSIPGDTKGKVLLYLHIDRWAQPLLGACVLAWQRAHALASWLRSCRLPMRSCTVDTGPQTASIAALAEALLHLLGCTFAATTPR